MPLFFRYASLQPLPYTPYGFDTASKLAPKSIRLTGHRFDEMDESFLSKIASYIKNIRLNFKFVPHRF